MKWVIDEKNGLSQKKVVGDLTFEAQYEPALYSLLKNNQPITKTNLARQEGHLITLKITSPNVKGDLLKWNTKNEEEFGEKLQYFSFSFEKDIFLEVKGKRYPCSWSHFERSADVRPQASFVLFFDKQVPLEGDRVLIIDSPQLNVGTIKIKFLNTPLPSVKGLGLD